MSDKRNIIRSYPGPVIQSTSEIRVRGHEVNRVILDDPRTMGDAASDPFEMESHEADR